MVTYSIPKGKDKKTKDVINDIWTWNEKCGSSNLNGMYHQSASASDLNGRLHHAKG